MQTIIDFAPKFIFFMSFVITVTTALFFAIKPGKREILELELDETELAIS